MIIDRRITNHLVMALSRHPVVVIIGPRQCGKTTLAKSIYDSVDKEVIYLDLENRSDEIKLTDPTLIFQDNREKLIIIDEAQRMPALFPQIRSEVDKKRIAGRFLLLGSASPELNKQFSETLAGRIHYIQLHPFDLLESEEIIPLKDLFFYGGFPPVVKETDKTFKKEWLDDFIFSYVERDLQMYGMPATASVSRRLWEMLAWQTGNLVNYTELARSLGVTTPTIINYIEFFIRSFMVRRVEPYFFNIRKRLKKSPKLYITDTGMLHCLLRITDYDQLLGNPVIGNSWETFVMNQVFALKSRDIDILFYRTQTGVEMDMVLVRGLKPVACAEIKFTSVPKISRGMTTALQDLQTRNNFIITPYSDEYRIREDITVCNISDFLKKHLDEI